MKSKGRISKISVFVTIVVFLFSFFPPPKSIYSVALSDIDNRTINLVGYKGEKMVFITLSGKETDSALNQLAAFCTKYNDSAAIIGVLSIEDGFSEAGRATTKQMFKRKIPGMLLTAGMYTRKTSSGQSELMQWLTQKEQNQIFDKEVKGPGHKFFVDETGKLYGVLGPASSLSMPLIRRIMSRPAKRPSPARSSGMRQN